MADVAVAESRLGAALWRSRPLAALAEAFAAEGDRRILWLPVFFGTGIALYFTPTFEPPWWLGLSATIATTIPAIALRRRPALRNAALALAFCAVVLAIMLQARWARGAPMLERRLHRVMTAGEDRGEGGWREWLLQLRNEMTRRIAAALPGSTGGVASAVITGKRGTMAEEVKQAFRDSGLSHLLAIAGLHLGLVGGFVFFTVRGGLALIPWVALRYPIKKITAVVTLIVLFCYLMISGAAIPTQRAFVMTGIVFVAVLIDRLRISMRICALAALVVLVIDPASLVGVSFQMSFGAVVALIAVYEKWGTQLAHLFHRGGFGRKALGYCGAVAITTVVATVGTEPFAIYHFHHLVLYSPLANVIAVPISAMWTLPWGVVACLLMPFGLEGLALTPMGWGIDVTIAVAQWVQSLPGNVWSMPRLPTFGVILVALGGCWLCLWQQRWRYWGIAGIAAGMAMMLLTRPPDLVLADFGHFLAARTPQGDYRVAAGAEKIHRSFLVSETGGRLLPWPGRGDPAADGLDCGGEARCRYTAYARRVASVTAQSRLPVSRYTGDAVAATRPARVACAD